MSQERIQEAATKDISSICRDINQSMSQVTGTEFDYQPNGIVVVNMRGLDAAGNAVGCGVAVRLGNSLKVVPVSFTPTVGVVIDSDDTPIVVSGNIQPTPIDDEDEVDTGDDSVEEIIDTPGVTPPAQDNATSHEGRLTHPSVRGYTMFFSNKSIAFA